ncbi:HNH endonuclease [Haloarcula nitratireducens]|uniref:HNH endonuclease n=1 Tax=Haloarcula nitratireducens TaxID=2487749 RepID=UPI003CCBD944
MSNLFLKTIVRGAHKAFGLDSPYSQKEYGKNWTKQRQKCLSRDGHQCRLCEKSKSEIGREPAVHHITPRSEFDDSDWRTYNALSNLITLCPNHHGKLEGHFTETDPDTFVRKANRFIE